MYQEKESSLTKVITFYVITIIFIVVTYFLSDHFFQNFTVELIIEISFAVFVLAFALSNFKEIQKLYRIPKLPIGAYILTILVPIVSGFVVYFGIDFINELIDPLASTNTFEEYSYLEYPLLWAIISIAIMPPIFEELAFRGYLFGVLKKITSDQITIIATSFLFALVHFSFISLLWIFPFGLFLGYLRKKYNTLWLCMIAHFIHNFIVVMLDYYSYHFLLLE